MWTATVISISAANFSAKDNGNGGRNHAIPENLLIKNLTKGSESGLPSPRPRPTVAPSCDDLA
jgi:hypothetical protein